MPAEGGRISGGDGAPDMRGRGSPGRRRAEDPLEVVMAAEGGRTSSGLGGSYAGLEVLVRGAVLAVGKRRALARLALARRCPAARDAAVEGTGLDLLLDVLDRGVDPVRDRPAHLRLVRNREVAADVLEKRSLRPREVLRIPGDPLDRLLTCREDGASRLELRLTVGVRLDEVLDRAVDRSGVLIHTRQERLVHRD